jgi:hypothetical protein
LGDTAGEQRFRGALEDAAGDAGSCCEKDAPVSPSSLARGREK